MIIKTVRPWRLKTKKTRDWVDILELHDGSDHSQAPSVCIPIEAIDEVIEALEKAKKEILNGGKNGN